MSRCEDFPCCGHDLCPDYIDGKQVNMVCICGKKLPLTNPSSLCNACLVDADDDDDDDDDWEENDCRSYGVGK
jgi:hypothetical protein